MDQRTFVFATRGHCIKGKQWQHITIQNQNMSLCSKQSSLFSFYALPSGGKSKSMVVHLNEIFRGWLVGWLVCSNYWVGSTSAQYPTGRTWPGSSHFPLTNWC